MNSDWLHIAIKQQFLECRCAAHEETMTPEEASDLYTTFGEELAELYGTEVAERAMSDFTGDLWLLNFMERFDHLVWLAVAFGYLTGLFMSEKRINRVMQLNDALFKLDAEYYKPD